MFTHGTVGRESCISPSSYPASRTVAPLCRGLTGGVGNRRGIATPTGRRWCRTPCTRGWRCEFGLVQSQGPNAEARLDLGARILKCLQGGRVHPPRGLCGRFQDPCSRCSACQVMLRQRGSKLPLKYPRCSLTRFEAFSDAEEDASLLRGMWGLWGALLVLGAALGTRGLYLGGSSLLGCAPSARARVRVTRAWSCRLRWVRDTLC